MEITAGITAHSARHLVMQMATYRRKVFVERLGWELQAQNGLEFDQFDRDDTMYVVAQDHNGWVTGCARLLPTTRPYLLGEVFPQLMQGQPLPCTPQVWELSRFAAMDLQAPSPRPSDQFSSPLAAGLPKASLQGAAQHGAQQVITVSPLGVERLLRKAGIHARRAGAPVKVGGHWLFACLIDCNSWH